MKKFAYIALFLMISTLTNAWTIKVKNDTGYDIKVAIYYLGTGEQIAAPLVAMDVFQKDIKDFKNKQYDSFVEGHGYDRLKQKNISTQNTDKWNLKNGCIRAVKAWIVEKKSIKAQNVASLKKIPDNSTLENAIYNLQYHGKWDQYLKENKTIEYVVYNPVLGDKYSWTTKVVHANENQCANHDFKVRVKKYDDGTKRLKIDIK